MRNLVAHIGRLMNHMQRVGLYLEMGSFLKICDLREVGLHSLRLLVSRCCYVISGTDIEATVSHIEYYYEKMHSCSFLRD